MIDLTSLKQTTPADEKQHVAATTTAQFEQDVIHASMSVPVIVDFWAPWCGPCKQLMPLLEKIVAAENGAVKMVTVNIDENPELAQIFRVQSVPVVYAFFGGQPVDGFMGVKPESALREFIAKLKKTAGIVTPVDVTAAMAQADKYLQDKDYDQAIVAYSNVLDDKPDHMAALAGIGWCFVAQGDGAALRDVLDNVEPAQKDDPELAGLYFMLAQTEDAADPAVLQTQLDAAPDDHAARHALARAQLARFDIAGAIESYMTVIRKDRDWNNGAARQDLLALFAALGNAHPETLAGRRKLSALLFS